MAAMKTSDFLVMLRVGSRQCLCMQLFPQTAIALHVHSLLMLRLKGCKMLSERTLQSRVCRLQVSYLRFAPALSSDQCAAVCLLQSGKFVTVSCCGSCHRLSNKILCSHLGMSLELGPDLLLLLSGHRHQLCAAKGANLLLLLRQPLDVPMELHLKVSGFSLQEQIALASVVKFLNISLVFVSTSVQFPYFRSVSILCNLQMSVELSSQLQRLLLHCTLDHRALGLVNFGLGLLLLAHGFLELPLHALCSGHTLLQSLLQLCALPKGLLGSCARLLLHVCLTPVSILRLLCSLLSEVEHFSLQACGHFCFAAKLCCYCCGNIGAS
mmetsp:Transcript_87241/g.159419  ORF Transcript_87241/g.159419 Transcript_87241/m.159419 type:complete len:325 (-) Transcript_87241:884-1858(-)